MLIIFIQLNLFKHMIKNEYKDFSKNDIRKYFLKNLLKEFIRRIYQKNLLDDIFR